MRSTRRARGAGRAADVMPRAAGGAHVSAATAPRSALPVPLTPGSAQPRIGARTRSPPAPGTPRPAQGHRRGKPLPSLRRRGRAPGPARPRPQPPPGGAARLLGQRRACALGARAGTAAAGRGAAAARGGPGQARCCEAGRRRSDPAPGRRRRTGPPCAVPRAGLAILRRSGGARRGSPPVMSPGRRGKATHSRAAAEA